MVDYRITKRDDAMIWKIDVRKPDKIGRAHV